MQAVLDYLKRNQTRFVAELCELIRFPSVSAQLQYKFNRFITFAFERSLYRTRAIPLTATGLYPSFQGRPMRELNDVRSEFGMIFTF